jgi:hypothetical protein
MNKAIEPDPVAAANAAVTAAEKTLTELLAQRDAVTAREQQLAAEQAKIAYSAHGRGNRKAKDRLSVITRELFEITSDLACIGDAIGEPEARLAAAKQRVIYGSPFAVDQAIDSCGH